MGLEKRYLEKILSIGSSSIDNESTRLKKISINVVSLIIGSVGFFWAVILYLLEHPISALIPMIYTIGSIILLIIFHKNKNLFMMQTGQMTLILLLPFLLTWSLGGLALSSFIFMWAFFAPVISLIHEKDSKQSYWLYSFIFLLIFSAIIDQRMIVLQTNPLSQTMVGVFFILNISVALSALYFLIKYFINKTDKNANTKLSIKDDALVNNTKNLHNTISYLESYKNNIDNNLIVTKTDLDGIITFANDNFYKMTGYSASEVIGSKHNINRHPDTSTKVFKDLWQTILSKKTWHGTLRNRKKDGSDYWIDTTISPILNKDNEIVEFIAIRHNITELIEHQGELEKLLYTDALTSLSNRNALLKELESQNKFSLILIDIDSFSHINHLYGEDFGNKVLIRFTEFLAIHTYDKVVYKIYRLAADQFAILSKEKDPQIIQKYSKKLLEKNNSNTIVIGEQDISLSLTLALSIRENNLLLSTANMALLAARKYSKNVMIYTDQLSLSDQYKNNLKWIKEIKEAIKEDRITMYFQPIIDNMQKGAKKYETLIRLIKKDGEVVTPFYFLEIAKKSKLYTNLSKIVVKKSFEAFKNNDYEFSINLTIDDILDQEFYTYLVSILEEYNISDRVIFEIVESEDIKDFDEVENFITKIKAYGCRISIDDFGTGYSNFEHLMRLQADFIKIDGSIIKKIVKDKRSALITSVIVAFAKGMNIQTIGEFVETKEINDKLIELGVDKSQGYFFDKPKATL